MIVGVVDKNLLKIEKKDEAYDTYYDKAIGYRSVSSTEITDLLADSGAIYNLRFFEDKVFSSLRVKDLQMDLYNSGSIINIDLELVMDYNQSLVGKKWPSLKSEEYFKTNLNF